MQGNRNSNLSALNPEKTTTASQTSNINSQLLDILHRYWGYDNFRGIQRQIIESILAGRDTLGLMPTGGGKSITFQVPALVLEGTCIVITPLIALMKDQVERLRRLHIKAAAIYSGMSHNDILLTLENAVFGAIKLLYISPERIGSELFRTKLRHMKVSFICVDEAHCISQWGYDFRPSYLTIADIRKDVPHVPVLALTATATPAVIDDIQQQLGFSERCVFRMSFERSNLVYVVRHTPNKLGQLVEILNRVEGSAIVYARSRRRTREMCDYLCQSGIEATFYHAGLDDQEKDKRQQAWQQDKYRVMVATNAFGMGIDKPDVRLVIHIDCPSSIEAYFQEAGRAGRDGQRAYAVLLYDNSDNNKLKKRIDDTFPPKDYIRDIYDHLAYFYEIGVGSGYNAIFEFPLDKFCLVYKFFPIQVNAALRLLERAGYIEYTEEQDSKARVRFIVDRDDLYRLHGNSPNEDSLIVAMLRNYSGLFSDFQFIDESLLAMLTGLNKIEVYQSLVTLSQKNILRFIPQKRTPYIRYIQRREESKHLQFPPHIYDDLRQRFAQRIEAMIDYATDEQHCRSRLLLRYFGETTTKDCGHCDVCLQKSGTNRPLLAEIRQAIMQLLADGQPHPIGQLNSLGYPPEIVIKAYQQLANEEIIVNDDGLIHANQQ